MPEMSRRTFLWLTGGSSIALAANEPRKLVNKLIPKVIPPEDIRPGNWQLFATTCRECPAGCGIHLWHRDGRVTKAEGNPDHPLNRGGLCARGQSSLQGLYDPDRVQQVMSRGREGKEQNRTFDQALAEISARLSAGGRVALISSLQTGTLSEVMRGFARAFGPERLLFYEAFDYEPLKAAHEWLFGLPVIPSYDLEGSDFILSFAADFLETWLTPVAFARQFATMHAFRPGQKMNRMAYVGPRFSMTAANADEFLQVPPGSERLVAATLLQIIVEQGWQKRDISSVMPAVDRLLAAAGPIPRVPREKLVRLARAFSSARAGVALAGPQGAAGRLATDTAVLTALLNYATGRIGQTVDFGRPLALSTTAREAELERFLDSLGPQDLLFIHDTNPAFSRPQAVKRLGRAGAVVYLGTMMDETAELASWYLPVDSPLESWGDFSPVAGIEGLMQPTMARLYDSRPAGDLLMELARRAGRPLARSTGGAPPADFSGWLRERWDALGGNWSGSEEAQALWSTALRSGGRWGEPHARATSPVTLARADRIEFALPVPPERVTSDRVELWPWSSVMSFDGRFANRGWLQEAPDPLSFAVWGNWIDLHPARAAALGLKDGDLAELSSATGSLRARVRISDEVSVELAAIALGHGHRALGKTARGVGANPFPLFADRTEDSMFASCRIRRMETGSAAGPIYTATTSEQSGRGIVQWLPLSHLARLRPGEGDELTLPLPEGYRPEKDMYPGRAYAKHRWAMVIDLHRCIGCGACAVACQAENNVPVVGRERVAKGREMAWLRVAPYKKEGDPRRLGWLPLLCHHCDAAPCEPVCPVFASMHNEEGLNAQIYNRCVGTRYCSNNCPYKVRRFNWVNIEWRPPLDLQLNPEVTVRARGVMEKCTFCVQRIRQADYQARREGRAIRDGEIQPACVQSCPARVFTFGDLLDPKATVTELTRRDPRRYHLLEELNTKPAVTFLKRIENDQYEG